MNKEELVKKWLDHSLSTEEQAAFEQLEDYIYLTQLNKGLTYFKAPDFSVDTNYETLKPLLKSKSSKSNGWLKSIIKIAAVLAISFSIYLYTTSLDTEFNTTIAQQTTLELPDASTADLNANSTITFNENDWSERREVKLNGEAFFKVSKGQKFDVITDDGLVRVLGTQFNVKQRKSLFEVTCYEGLVAVTHNNNTVKLKPGYTFQLIDGKLNAIEKEITTRPNWLRGESSFKGIPLKFVISEFENQYNLKITTEHIDTSRLFTGSFTHENLDLALQSVTIALNLSYSISGNSILLKRE